MNLDYQKSKRLALAALLFCAVGMIVCRWFEAEMPWLGWLRAFFEAGTIGALADWFAVVVLFRHPFGIPIPHTAILPNNKDRVAESLANFLETSFLTEEQLGPRFREMNYAGFASRWLAENAAMLSEKAVRFAPEIVSSFSDEEMTALLSERAREMIGQAEVGPLVGGSLEVLLQNGRDREIFLAALRSARQLIEEHRGTIQAKINNEIPLSGEMLRAFPLGKNLVGPLLEQVREGIAAAVAGKTIEKIQSALNEAAAEPSNPLWQSFRERLDKLIEELKSSPERAAKIRSLQDSLAGSQVVDDFAAKTWREIKAFLLRDCAAEDSTVRHRIEAAILSVSRQLAENPSVQNEINTFIGDRVLAALLNARPHAREIVISTIQAWDGQEMANRLERIVGRDLQFIRLNGTIVGGLVGLIIHAAFFLLGK